MEDDVSSPFSELIKEGHLESESEKYTATC
jgi:hypothetical protein